MIRRGLTLAAVTVAAIAVAGAVSARPEGAFTQRGTVVSVVDGDTIQVRLSSGGTERVRLIGIDTPERGHCYSSQATARARQLALGKRVVLKGDPTQDTRDRYRRLLAYAWIGGTDLGYRLILGGFGKTYVYRAPFQRLPPYRRAEQAAKSSQRGLWSACAKPVSSGGTGAGCHGNYSPCLPVVADLDCADVRALGKAPVRVLGADPYRLDGDNDGWGCE